jgi:hypothetical protein
VRRAGRRCSGGGRFQEPGQERVFLAHGLVAHDGDLTVVPQGLRDGQPTLPTPRASRSPVAGCGHEGDDPATLEEAEDALTRALDDLLDILLRGCGRGMEHLALAVSVWRVNTLEKQAVKVGVAPEVAGGAMNGGDRAALAARKSAVSLALVIPFGTRACTPCPCPTRLRSARRHRATVSVKMRRTWPSNSPSNASGKRRGNGMVRTQ